MAFTSTKELARAFLIGPGPAAVEDSINQYGGWLQPPETARRWSDPEIARERGGGLERVLQIGFGLGLYTAQWADGLPIMDNLTRHVDAVAWADFASAVERGDSWSEALRLAFESDRSGGKWLWLTHLALPADAGPLAEYGFVALGGLQGAVEVMDVQELPDGSLDHVAGWAFFYAHPRAAVLEAVRALELETAAVLRAEAEPEGARRLRERAAEAGTPIPVDQARYQYARRRGLSTTEAQQLRNPPMARPTTIRADSLSRSFSVLQGARAADVVPRMGDAPAPTNGGAEPFGAWTPTVYGGAVGAVVGGLLGRLVTGSFGMGAGLGAAGGAVLGGGGAYLAAGGDI